MEIWKCKVAVVTDANSEIGWALVKDLIEVGMVVSGLAPSLDVLEELCKELPQDRKHRFFPVSCDLTDVDSINVAFDWIAINLRSVDVLLCNVGTAKQGEFNGLEKHQLDDVLNTNVRGVFYCALRAFENMKVREFNGQVLAINCISTFRTSPGNTVNPLVFATMRMAMMAMKEVYNIVFANMETKIKITTVYPRLFPSDSCSESSGIVTSDDVSAAVFYAMTTPQDRITEIVINPPGVQEHIYERIILN